MNRPKYSLDEKVQFARDMRRKMTRAEQVLWYKLSRNHFGFRFVRQALLRGYIVDFYCANLRLVIEVDGSIHDIEDKAADDEQRDRILENYGFLVLRFTNEDVLDHTTVVLTRLWDECTARRTALKAFPIRNSSSSSNSRVPSRPCESVEKQADSATLDKVSVQRIPATAEDYRLINRTWRSLCGEMAARTAQMTGAEFTTSAEYALETLRKRSESAALTVKGMHVTDFRRQA